MKDETKRVGNSSAYGVDKTVGSTAAQYLSRMNESERYRHDISYKLAHIIGLQQVELIIETSRNVSGLEGRDVFEAEVCSR